MSPLLDRQRQGVRLGSIRIGTKVVTANGKTRPEKLDTFRLTSPDKVKVEAAAGLYGGQVKPWKPNDGAAQQWEVVTTVDRLPVRVPPGNPVEQWYEQWKDAFILAGIAIKGRERQPGITILSAE